MRLRTPVVRTLLALTLGRPSGFCKSFKFGGAEYPKQPVVFVEMRRQSLETMRPGRDSCPQAANGAKRPRYSTSPAQERPNWDSPVGWAKAAEAPSKSTARFPPCPPRSHEQPAHATPHLLSTSK